ncbi:hypothetical protein E0H77_00500 [Acinetobacter sp. ANC 4633]|uniref:hypothetical protein n=1 Tax=Acinetobacter sp. ANC 4633 TaxID=2529845 RepID=UPI00103E901A|nr:hypothetical protein [Acinetobacter sp. ANC 4633]TCB28658.1 hypothetical protein E0H77_00500 [Acinetobacter sp. ANC 4633]
MQLQAHSKVGARFKLIVRKASDDSIARETDWFHNLVLDTGLNRMSVGTWIDRCCVGTGNSTPVATQTALNAFLASTTTRQATTTGTQTTTSPYYRWAKVTWRFGQGVAAGNVSEVGLGWGNANLWNRALIKDANGNPTTITVLSDEYLDVVSEIRNYPTQSLSGAFNLLDKNSAVIGSYTYNGIPWFSGTYADFSKIAPYQLSVYSGVKGTSVTTAPSTQLGSITTPAISATYPTPTSMQVVGTFNLNDVNGTHQSFLLQTVGLMTYGNGSNPESYQFQISPTITKTSSQIMTYAFTMSWGRYIG